MVLVLPAALVDVRSDLARPRNLREAMPLRETYIKDALEGPLRERGGAEGLLLLDRGFTRTFILQRACKFPKSSRLRLSKETDSPEACCTLCRFA